MEGGERREQGTRVEEEEKEEKDSSDTRINLGCSMVWAVWSGVQRGEDIGGKRGEQGETSRDRATWGIAFNYITTHMLEMLNPIILRIGVTLKRNTYCKDKWLKDVSYGGK